MENIKMQVQINYINTLKKSALFVFVLMFLSSGLMAQNSSTPRSISFDKAWLFTKDSVTNAEQPDFNDSQWRKVDLPHDWSIEDLPNQEEGKVQGPFTKSSIGRSATGFTEGGIGWYRKSFTLDNNYSGKQVSVNFDGVYMISDVWLNGKHLGTHPNGYTSFSYNLTNYLKTDGTTNIIAVRVKNLGKNSRWYSGSGIYRHVWLTAVNEVHTELYGSYITTPEVSESNALVKVETAVQNVSSGNKSIEIGVDIISPSGKVVASKKQPLTISGESRMTSTQELSISKPALWSLESPQLYTANVKILADGKIIDQTLTTIGIRSLRFDGQKGFMLNGKVVKLKGGCIHHDHGPLGSASFDRAEERKVELLKKAGYNAIRLSHNPMSPALLDACDRLGMLVLTDAFDSWEQQKLEISEGYHLYFKEWWKRDLQSMILRDRNHPSIIMWGIGNEIWEAADTTGYRIAKQITNEVRRLDPTRAVTEAIILLPERIKYSWEEYGPHLANLDVDGYNYFVNGKIDPNQRDSATIHRYESEHAKYPNKLYMATESFPSAALENWDITEKYPFVIGGFCWTAMDYIGEAGTGRPVLLPEDRTPPKGLMSLMYFFKPLSWPIFNSYCGDLDLIGNRKAASYYQNVVWRNSPIEMLVHRPIPVGKKEVRSPWGFPDELKSWTWLGQEGKKMQVHVYSRSKVVKLELNGKVVSEQTIPDGSITATFEIEYQPGTLVAKGFDGGKQTCSSTLKTTGKPVGIRLVADRKTIKADLNDLSYISVEIIDENGNVVPSIDDMEVTYQLNGNATIAGVGNGNAADMSSFQQPKKKVFQGRGLVIIKPRGTPGKITLKANATGLKEGSVEIITQ